MEEAGGKRTRGGQGGPPGPEDQGKHSRCFPAHLGPRKPVGLLVWSLHSRAPSAHVGPRGMVGRKKKRGQWEGTLQDQRECN